MLSSSFLLFLIPFFWIKTPFVFYLTFSLNSTNLLFMSTILIISMSVIHWSSYYMKEEKEFSSFNLTTTSFIFSMLFFIMSEDPFSVLLGYDMLGITSFLLIMYYKSQKVLNSALITLMMNKLGDFFLIWAVLSIFSNSLWNSPTSTLCLILAMMVKSAQIPFSAWLPVAMAAPTPISALVHSSTLVTAGIYLLMKYSLNEDNLFLYMSVSSTLLFASLLALVEMDMKKIVALSTMSQMSFIALIFSLGMKPLSFLHLLTHALFKSMMFINMGNLIHQTYNNQQTKMLATSSKTTIFLMQMSGLSLMGLAFTSGFTSKDNFLDKMENTNSTSLMLLMSFLISLTFFYTSRLLFPLSQNLPTKEKSNPSLSLFLLSLLFSTLMMSKETPESFKILSLIFQCSFVFIMSSIMLKLKLTNKIINNSFKILNKLHLNMDMPFKYFLEKTFFSNSSLLLMKMKQMTFILSSLLIFSILFMS